MSQQQTKDQHKYYRDFIGFVSKPHNLQIRNKTNHKLSTAVINSDYKLVRCYKGMMKNGNNYNKIKRANYLIYKYI